MKINKVSQDVSKTFIKKEVTIHSDITNKDYKVEIDKKFRKTKLTNLFVEMSIRADLCLKKGIIFDFTLCQWCMILTQFTNIEFDKGTDIVETYLKEIVGVGNLIDAEILDKIILSFDEDELKKIEEVAKTLGEFTSRMHDIEIEQLVNNVVGEEDVSL